MIQKYLQPGVRLKWNAPTATQQALDGAIVDNRGIASNMTYDGLDGELINPSMMVTNAATLGFTMRMPIRHVWLDYNYGRTARCAGGRDVLTGFMSGCIIARWTQNPGGTFVGHVGTLVGQPAVNTQVKNTFLNACGNQVTGFNPASAWTQGECDGIASKFKKKPTGKIMARASCERVLEILTFNRLPGKRSSLVTMAGERIFSWSTCEQPRRSASAAKRPTLCLPHPVGQGRAAMSGCG